MKFIQFDSSGALFTRFDSDFHGEDIPADALQVSDDLFFRTIQEADGVWTIDRSTGDIEKMPIPAPSIGQTLDALQDFVRRHLDQTATTFGFLGIADAVSYAEEPSVQALQQKGKALRAWRSKVMEVWLGLVARVEGGEPTPTEAQLLEKLPTAPGQE